MTMAIQTNGAGLGGLFGNVMVRASGRIRRGQ